MNMQDTLEAILKEGGAYRNAEATYRLYHAIIDESSAQLRLLHSPPSELQPVEEKIHLKSWDYDAATGKFYAAYSSRAYAQIVPLPPEERAAHRKDLEDTFDYLSTEVLPPLARLKSWPVQQPEVLRECLLDTIRKTNTDTKLDNQHTGRLEGWDNLQIGNAILLAHRLQQSGKPLMDWLCSHY